MTFNRVAAFLTMGSLSLALLGCGGSGSDAPAPTTFPLRAAYGGLVQAGSHDTFESSGYCTGTLDLVTAPAVPATFEGIDGYASSVTATADLLCDGHTSADTTTITQYHRLDFAPLGDAGGPDDEGYSRFEIAPVALPVSVKVGDAGSLGSTIQYLDDTKAVVYGTTRVSYVIEADTPATAIFVMTSSTDYVDDGWIDDVSRYVYRINQNGTLTLLSVTVSYPGSDVPDLVYTKI